MLFNLFYCGGEVSLKLASLYDTVTRTLSKPGPVKFINDERLIAQLELLICIPTFLIANMVEQ
jgi:hypothetical protein